MKNEIYIGKEKWLKLRNFSYKYVILLVQFTIAEIFSLPGSSCQAIPIYTIWLAIKYAFRFNILRQICKADSAPPPPYSERTSPCDLDAFEIL